MFSVSATAAALALFLSAYMTGQPVGALAPVFYTVEGTPVTSEDIVDSFRMSGDSVFYFNPSDPYRHSSFDIRQYVNHPCFHTVGREDELAQCERLLDHRAADDLQDMLDSGELARLLNREGLLGPVEAFLIDQAQADTQDIPGGAFGGPDQDEPSMRQTIRARSEQVWQICENMTLTELERGSCFQENMRLIQRTDVPIFGNVHVPESRN